MPEETLTVREFDKRHGDLTARVERAELRIDKVEIAIDAKDAEAQKIHADIRREQSESYLKLLEAIHFVKDEVAKDRLATLGLETKIANRNNNTLRWIIGLIVSLVSGGGLIEMARFLLTGKP